MREKVKTAGLSDARVNMAGCMDQCENGPVLVVYPEGIWYSAKTTADIDRIVDGHLVGGKIISDLQLTAKIKRERKRAGPLRDPSLP